eukprot:TRINITY_DN31041_c0_g1_i1.p1 TRINITY_DN31041_c0_g1~~TRINITY_DN31041_c0_g1_i1.p1  ORF type:complete len:638 (+),score=89.93 TRINITY_DN31041_c0_g1_i1:32-1915(+)
MKDRAKALAQQAGCSLELARAALNQVGCVKGGYSAAKRLLGTKPAEIYAGAAATGPTHGDSVFAHPYVKCLLEVARSRVREVLAAQPEDDRWLVCVRSYGRAGVAPKSFDLRRYIQKFWTSGRQKNLFHALVKNGIDDLAKLRAALDDPQAMKKKLKQSNDYVGRLGENLRKLQKAVEVDLPPVNLMDDFPRAFDAGVMQLTLDALERALGPEAYRRCLLFCSHEDKSVVSGEYAAVLENTPWSDRVVQGVKGAHLQVRFIEEANPRRGHVVIVDDNIRNIVVECSTEQEIDRQKKSGNMSYYVRPLDFRRKQSPLGDAKLELFDEGDIHWFVRGSLGVQEKKMKRMDEQVSICRSLSFANIASSRELRTLLLADKSGHGTFRKVGIKANHVKKLRAQAVRPLPARLVLVRPMQKSTGNLTSTVPTSELAELIRRAGREMQNNGANIWGVNTSKNHFWLHTYGNEVRAKAKKIGIFSDISTRIGLVYGAFFGIRALQEPRRYTRYGQVKDDVERTLRYWDRDGVGVRFQRFGVIKHCCHEVGKYNKKKGGISADSSFEKHEAESRQALTSMLNELGSNYARLASPGERSSCGLIWKRKEAPKFHREFARPTKRFRSKASVTPGGLPS